MYHVQNNQENLLRPLIKKKHLVYTRQQNITFLIECLKKTLCDKKKLLLYFDLAQKILLISVNKTLKINFVFVAQCNLILENIDLLNARLLHSIRRKL